MTRNSVQGIVLGLALTLFAGILSLQGQQLLSDQYIQRMKQDMQILATDSLEGREAGSMGELYAALYVAERFEQMGIKPYFGICYYQDFEFPDGYEFEPQKNQLEVIYGTRQTGGKQAGILTTEDFTPLPWGAAGEVRGEMVDGGWCLKDLNPAQQPDTYNRWGVKTTEGEPKNPDWKGKVVLARYDVPPGYKGTAGVNGTMVEKAKYAAGLGAAAVLFYAPDQTLTHVPGNFSSNEDVSVPVCFIHNGQHAFMMEGLTMNLRIEKTPKKSFGKNVAGWIDNGASRTIVIGAHYDHLGWGFTNSRNEGMPAIHYGADDNASGVTGMLALAEWLSQSHLRKSNYLFIAFSAEEKGLLGSKHFTSTESFDKSQYLCMLNYDMIGRVKKEEPSISLLASGSSPVWDQLIPGIGEDLTVVSVEGGLNGSDHHFFYANQIPVLFFFNGIHEDYHKPTDVVEKINYQGLRDVVEYTIHLLGILDTIPSLPYQEVSETETSTRRAGKISLGIVPAHGVEAEGVLVQEVIPGKPAFKGGMLKDDLIIQVSGDTIKNITDYMKALNMLSAGQKVKVKVLRNGKKKTITLQL